MGWCLKLEHRINLFGNDWMGGFTDDASRDGWGFKRLKKLSGVGWVFVGFCGWMGVTFLGVGARVSLTIFRDKTTDVPWNSSTFGLFMTVGENASKFSPEIANFPWGRGKCVPTKFWRHLAQRSVNSGCVKFFYCVRRNLTAIHLKIS